MSRLRVTGLSRARVSAGRSATPAGKSHSCETPTSVSWAPSAQTISVADGSNDATRMVGPSAREPELGVARPDAGLGQAQLAADDIGALHERDALVVGDPPAQTLAAGAAVGGDHQPLGRDVLEGLPDEPGDVLRRLDHRVAVADPGLAAHRQVEAAVVRHDVEARGFLGIDDGGHG